MRKKLISLISVCSILATMVVGMANMAYASEDAVLNAVYDSENSTDTVKYVDLYYSGEDDGIIAFAAQFTADVEASITLSLPEFGSDVTWNDQENAVYAALNDAKNFTDKKLGTVTITVSTTDAFNLTISDIDLQDGSEDESFPDDVVVTIPASTPPTPVVVEPAIEVSGADAPLVAAYTDETVNVESVADIFKVVVTANEYNTGAISDLKVSVEGNEKFVGTTLDPGANTVIAVVIGYKGAVSKGFVPTVTAVVE